MLSLIHIKMSNNISSQSSLFMQLSEMKIITIIFIIHLKYVSSTLTEPFLLLFFYLYLKSFNTQTFSEVFLNNSART